MVRIILGGAAGAIIGGLIGYFTKCAGGGGCPMMGNPVGGVLFGAIIGILFATSFQPRQPAFTPSKNVADIGDRAGFEEMLKSNPVVLADFYADWCGPCRRLKPAVHELADEYAGRVAVAAVNVDRNREIAEQLGVSGIPDVRIFKNGTQVHQVVGLSAKGKYAGLLDSVLASQ